MYFEQTQTAIQELAGDRRRQFGEHFSLTPRTGLPGIRLGEMRFDPTIHDEPDPFSRMEQATGLAHARIVLPRRALNIQIIEDRSPSGNDPRIEAVKQDLIPVLTDTLTASKPGMTDRVWHHVIDSPGHTEYEQMGYGVDIIDFTQGPELVADTVAEICTRGLTFIVSDFKNLWLERLAPHTFEDTVGVKANHLADIEVPPSPKKRPVVLNIKGSRELDTSDPKELERFNRSLDVKNRIIEERLQAAGISIAKVVFRPRLASGFDIWQTDSEIAEALTKLDKA